MKTEIRFPLDAGAHDVRCRNSMLASLRYTLQDGLGRARNPRRTSERKCQKVAVHVASSPGLHFFIADILLAFISKRLRVFSSQRTSSSFNSPHLSSSMLRQSVSKLPSPNSSQIPFFGDGIYLPWTHYSELLTHWGRRGRQIKTDSSLFLHWHLFAAAS